MRQFRRQDGRFDINPVLILIALPFIVLFHLLKWLTGNAEPPVSSQNFARQGSGGRFRRVTQDEVNIYLQPLNKLIGDVEELKRRSGRMPADEARRLLSDARALADKIDRACADFERQNFSFAHKSSAAFYQNIIGEGRKVADQLRDTKLSEPLHS